MLRPEIGQRTIDQIKFMKEKLQTTQSKQKSYADQRQKPLEFQEDEHIFLRVSPTIGVGRSLKSRKLSPRFLGPLQVLRRVRSLAYQLALVPNLSKLHDDFHVSQLKRYCSDPS